MPSPVQALQQIGKQIFLNLRFGFGIASAFDRDNIDVQECIDGQNFDLDLDNESFRNRLPFDLVATAPNAQAIRGFVELIKTDGTVTNLVQAGGIVYQWDGQTTFTQVGTCNAASRLRGNRRSTSLLDDKVIITDLEKRTVIKTWDGTTYESLAHDLGGDLYAKYCVFRKERAFYANVKSGSTDTPHVLLGSARGASIGVSDFASLSVANRPGTGLSDSNPFFIPMPDLRPINGIDASLSSQTDFGVIILSTQEGSLWELTGETPKLTEADRDSSFQIREFYPGSAAAGDEAMANIGNDILYGRFGALETVRGTEKFGDIETDDVSRWIKNQVKTVKSWTIVYDPQGRKAYLWAEGGNEVWVLHVPLYDPRLRATRTATPGGTVSKSPWSKWVTDFGNSDFRQTAAMLMRRVTDRNDVVYFGDSVGRILQIDGAGLQDGGSADIVAKRTSGTIRLPKGDIFDVKGTIKYRRLAGATVTLTFLFGGREVLDIVKTITIPAPTTVSVYNGTGDNAAYYGGDFFYGIPFEDRIYLQPWRAEGKSTHLEVEAKVTGAEFDIKEITIEISPVR